VRITKTLLYLHNRAKEIFKMRDIPSYMPHLSLLYGDLPQLVKEKIIEKIGKNQSRRFTTNGIQLVETNGEVNTWRKVREWHFL